MTSGGGTASELQVNDIYRAIVERTSEPLYDPDQAAPYFMEIREDFENVKRCLSALAGTVILYHAKAKHMEGTGSLAMMSPFLQSSMERLHTLQIPRGLEKHHGTLCGIVRELLELCRAFPVDRHLFSLQADTISNMLERIQKVYETLKKTACMPLGLSMVALDSGCACGLHGKSTA
jgi:hypothetical protein